jgi:hypothetical protein
MNGENMEHMIKMKINMLEKQIAFREKEIEETIPRKINAYEKKKIKNPHLSDNCDKVIIRTRGELERAKAILEGRKYALRVLKGLLKGELFSE